MKASIRTYYLLLVLGLLLVASLALSNGAMSLSLQSFVDLINLPESQWDSSHKTLFYLRIPRVLMSILVGASLAVAGSALQGIFRNPLADPTIIGVSTGAAATASLGIVLFSGATFAGLSGASLLTVMTFVGACSAAWLVLKLGKDKNKTNVATMLLAGIAINAFGGAFTGLMTYLASDAQLRSLTFWTLGSVAGATWSQVAFLALVATVVFVFIGRLAQPLNILALGEKEAAHLGVKVERLKVQVVIGSAILVAVTVATCGMIGFIGLVAPHIIRMGMSGNHKFLIPASALLGAVILTLADTVARTIVAPAELPIGIITALVGAPMFLYLLVNQKKSI